MTNGNNNIEELEELLSELEGQDNQAITPYSEDEDAVTQLMEAPLSEQEWMVQVTALDRRMMATEQLLGEFQSGKLSDQTLVWRGGMDDWLPLGRVEELSNPEAAMAATATVTEANAAPPSPMGSAPAWSAPQPMASRPQGAPPPPPGSAAVQPAPAPSTVSSPTPVKPADVTQPVPSPQTYTARPVAVDFSGTAAAEEAGGLLQSKRAVLSLGAVALVAVVAIGLSLPAGTQPSTAANPAEDKATAAAQPIAAPEPEAEEANEAAELTAAPEAEATEEAKAVEEAKPAEDAAEMAKMAKAVAADEDGDEASEEASTEAEEKPAATKRASRKKKPRSRWRRRSSRTKKATARRAKQEEPEEAAEEPRQETLSEAMQRAGGGASDRAEEPVASKKAEEPDEEPTVSSGSSTFDGSAAEKVLNQAASQAANCQPPGGPSGSGRVRVKYATSGKVDSVTILTDDFKNTTTGSCVRLLFRRARVPKFEGEPVVLTKRFSIP